MNLLPKIRPTFNGSSIFLCRPARCRRKSTSPSTFRLSDDLVENGCRMVDLSLTRKSACELVELIRAREVTPVEVLQAHFARIHQINPALNAIVTLDEDGSLASAEAA